MCAARRREIVRDLTQTTVLLGRPAIRQVDPDYFPLAVATYVLGGGSASRLYTRVREERGLAYSVYSSLLPARYGASYLVSLQTRTDGVGEAVRLTREEMARLGREPVAPRELTRAKSYLIGSFPLRLDTSASSRLPGSGGGERARARLPGRYKERIAGSPRLTSSESPRSTLETPRPSEFRSAASPDYA